MFPFLTKIGIKTHLVNDFKRPSLFRKSVAVDCRSSLFCSLGKIALLLEGGCSFEKAHPTRMIIVRCLGLFNQASLDQWKRSAATRLCALLKIEAIGWAAVFITKAT